MYAGKNQREKKILSNLTRLIPSKIKTLFALQIVACFSLANEGSKGVCEPALQTLLKLEYVKEAGEWQLTDENQLGVYRVKKTDSQSIAPNITSNANFAAWVDHDVVHVVNLHNAEHFVAKNFRQRSHSISIDSTGRRLLVRATPNDESLVLVDLKEGTNIAFTSLLKKINPHKVDQIREIWNTNILQRRTFALSSDFRSVAARDAVGRNVVFSTSRGEVRFTLNTYFTYFGFSKNGQYFIAIDAAKTFVEVYDLTGKLIARYKDPSQKKVGSHVHQVYTHEHEGHDYVTVDFVNESSGVHQHQTADLDVGGRVIPTIEDGIKE